MTLNERLIDLIDWTHESKRRFVAGLGDNDRAAMGQPDAWAARDVIAHFAEWDEVMCRQLEAAVEQGEPPLLPEDDEINRVFFDRNSGSSWAEVMSKADNAHEALVSQVKSMPEDVLATSAWLDERPIWAKVVFANVYHALRHLWEYLVARGDGDAAVQLMEEGSRRMAAVDDSARHRAVVLYNLACHYALGGYRERALISLGEALAIAPEMAGYALEDDDLAGLRDDPAFQSLLAG